MGGNALKNTPTRRYKRDEYLELENEVIGMLGKHMYVDNIPTYKTKESFGDMDLLCLSSKKHSIDIIKSLFSPNEIFKNGNVISFDYKELQIDLIHFDQIKDLRSARAYFSFGDRGNLVGRISRRLGFKYGHDGLKYVLREPNNPSYVIEEVIVSNYNPDEIFKFLGYEPKKHFDDIQDIFEWVCSSEYFDVGSFNLQFRSHDARVRDRKRPFYNKFLTYLRENHGLTDEHEPSDLDHEYHLQRAFETFPTFKVRYDSALINFYEKKKFGRIMSHETIREVCSVDGKELGKEMKYWKEFLPNTSAKNLLLGLEEENSKKVFKILVEDKHAKEEGKKAGSNGV